MDQTTRTALEAINRRFYAQRAAEFDASRTRPWQGWERALGDLDRSAALRVLDLGCGNGRLLAHLLGKNVAIAEYLGVDGCEALLGAARTRHASESARFEHGELFDVAGQPSLPEGSFDLVALMGVLHHVPGAAARAALVRDAYARTRAGGRLVLTVWRFERDRRLAGRALSWPVMIARDPLLAGLDSSQLEPGDALLTWNRGGSAVRYCHAVAESEIERWLEGVPARVDRFHADGEGELNEYVVLSR